MTTTWNESLNLGHAVIDQDHFAIATAADRILAALARPLDADRPGEREAQIAAALTDLRQTTEKHFQSEEWIMAASDFPGIRGHRFQHAELLAELDRFIAALDPKTSGDIAPLAQFLRSWLEVHLQVWDASLVKWLNALDPEREGDAAALKNLS